ncbi:hypothetical protein BDB01DRAFT_787714 [Pilobolus umbonatus]|nr:hypothetical protein BDB01DRAFT_787714 [Pilobolus umbonatus]
MNPGQSILIHASVIHPKSVHCKRDLLVSSSMTLYQLHQFISCAFELDDTLIDDHSFSVDTVENDSIAYEIVDNLQQDGFLTLITPGLYIGMFFIKFKSWMIITNLYWINIEHTHPHEPLPLFSIDKSTSNKDELMSFRLVQDERYCCLDNILESSNQIHYGFNYADYTQHYTLHLDLQTVHIPLYLLKDSSLYPKVINKQGHILNSPLHSIKVINNTMDTRYSDTDEVLPMTHIDKHLLKCVYDKGKDRLLKERIAFLSHLPDRRKCYWVEPNGERCVYCSLSLP